ncbi:MAG TPA: hypothetical protein VLG72_05595, partial [Nitrospirota bacterium]|nr:hypothetical protein [Nitrospirota bacterium]
MARLRRTEAGHRLFPESDKPEQKDLNRKCANSAKAFKSFKMIFNTFFAPWGLYGKFSPFCQHFH